MLDCSLVFWFSALPSAAPWYRSHSGRCLVACSNTAFLLQAPDLHPVQSGLDAARPARAVGLGGRAGGPGALL